MQMAKANEVLVCGRVYTAIASLLRGKQVEARGEVTLRGKSEPITVYSIKGPSPAR